jgi:hypothetical protein
MQTHFSTPLSVRVFQNIASRLASKSTDIARFVSTRYSFEEWLTWEAFAACSAIEDWEVGPKPSYRTHGVQECRDYGDLLVVEGRESVLVELGLVHDGTSDKWRTKLEWDVQKLARPLAGVRPLHIIVVASVGDIAATEAWQKWLGKVGCWNRPTELTYAAVLPPSGSIMLRGWC